MGGSENEKQKQTVGELFLRRHRRQIFLANGLDHTFNLAARQGKTGIALPLGRSKTIWRMISWYIRKNQATPRFSTPKAKS